MFQKAIVVGVVVLVSLGLGLVGYVLSGHVIVLQAEEQVEIYGAPKGTIPNAAIKVLGAGEEIPVIGCDVEKDDVTPVVRLPDGRRGYAIGGRISLKRSRGSLSDLDQVVHGCG